MSNHDGRDGTAPDPLVWSAGALTQKAAGLTRFGTGHSCPARPVFGAQNGFFSCILPSALRTLLSGPKALVSWLSGSPFLVVFHWPAGGLDLGVGGISYVELLILYELWAGERLSLEKAHPRHLRPGRPIFSVGCSFWSRH